MSAGDWKDMYAAALAGDLALVRHHIGAGVNPNYQHPEILCTPLVAALIHGHDAIAHYLLDHGADPQLRSEFDGMTPLQAARRHGRAEFVTLLRERGAREVKTPFWWRWLPL
ncbi:ankyrin repeat domain-containing protein [Acidovorax sp. LjRoot117]|uniref:ankyrin repeat domain-containing protein n=1 Tax=Acidovorax sp. LjRoot117 TaxID=3342255 RepID=UPI003ECEB6C2